MEETSDFALLLSRNFRILAVVRFRTQCIKNKVTECTLKENLGKEQKGECIKIVFSNYPHATENE